jgi:hypothetical protein
MKKTTMVLMTTKKMVPRVGVAAVAALVVVTTEKVVLHNAQVVQRLTLLAEAEFTRTIVFDI